MKTNIKTRVAIFILVLIAPFLIIYMFAFLTFAPDFKEYVRDVVNTTEVANIIGIYYMLFLCGIFSVIDWVKEG